MKLVFYSLVLNHHQACVADEFYDILGDDYAFVETAECNDQKGATEDYSKRSYLVKAWESAEAWSLAMELAETAEVCVFSGYEALPFEKARMKRGLLSFDMGERMLKRGWLNLTSPRILKMIMAYHLGGWSRKPLYKLCCSSFAKGDQYKLWSFKNRCYKWGYFTKVESFDIDEKLKEQPEKIKIMWCARFLKLKHPELPVLMASRLKKEGYSFVLDFYGDGVELEPTKELAESLELSDCVKFHGAVPNDQALEAMRKHDIFLFTSNQLEGWGAVVNEAMSKGCAVVGSDAIGSVPYLIDDGVTGWRYQDANVDSLCDRVRWLLNHPNELGYIQRNAYTIMQNVWSPENAAKSLFALIDNLKRGKESPIMEGPCSKA